MIVRDATSADADDLAMLTTELGFPQSAGDIRRRWSSLLSAGNPPLVADENGLLGCLAWHVMPVFHRPAPVGRITMLVVAAHARSRGVGRALVEAAEIRFYEHGCGLVEVTSNVRLADAHLFYQHIGYEKTSFRFAKILPAAVIKPAPG